MSYKDIQDKPLMKITVKGDSHSYEVEGYILNQDAEYLYFHEVLYDGSVDRHPTVRPLNCVLGYKSVW